MDPKGKGIVINDKEKESFVNEPKDDKPTDSGSGHRRKEGKKTRRIKEWVSDCSSSDSDNDRLAATAFNKSSLFPNERHTCLMAREKKVCTRNSTYASSSEEESAKTIDEILSTSSLGKVDKNLFESITPDNPIYM